MKNLPWSRYKMPGGNLIYLTVRPDVCDQRDVFNFAANMDKRIYFCCEPIDFPATTPNLWIPWFINEGHKDGSGPAKAAIATALSEIRKWDQPRKILWLHCDSSSMRAPTFFGLYLKAFYPDQIDEILASRESNEPNRIWGDPKDYQETEFKLNPSVEPFLADLKVMIDKLGEVNAQ